LLLKKSRYQNSRLFEVQGEEGTFQGVRAREINSLDGVIEHQVTDNDRLDLLALHYFNDSSLWWRIVDANPEIIFADHMLGKEWIGRAILIPTKT